MSDPNFVLLYVQSPTDSARFYADLLGKAPVDAAPTFAMFALDSGVMLGLWATSGVQPAPMVGSGPGGGELAFAVQGDDAVGVTHAAWLAKGLTVIQQPTRMDFGYTFVALDPDGHRLRVFAPSAS